MSEKKSERQFDPPPGDPGRVCKGGCGTVLNAYNVGSFCSLCDPLRKLRPKRRRR